MNKTPSRMILILVTAALCSLLVWYVYDSVRVKPLPPMKLQVGQQMPTVPVMDLFNQPVEISSHSEQFLLLNIWATWCGPCREEIPSLVRMSEKLGKQHIRLTGLSVDDDEHVVREYLIDRGVTFNSFIDKGMTQVNAVFGVRVFPTTYLVNPDGIVIEIFEGPLEWDGDENLQRMRRLMSLQGENSVQKKG